MKPAVALLLLLVVLLLRRPKRERLQVRGFGPVTLATPEQRERMRRRWEVEQ